MAISEIDLVFMKQAATEALKCVPSLGAYSVGAALVSADGRLLALGYSRELPGNTHAEECALAKARPLPLRPALLMLRVVRVVFQVAQCTQQWSPAQHALAADRVCSSLIIDAQISRVTMMGLAEPPNFVVCEGVARLQQRRGVRVDWRN